jgi:hypothetical protein
VNGGAVRNLGQHSREFRWREGQPRANKVARLVLLGERLEGWSREVTELKPKGCGSLTRATGDNTGLEPDRGGQIHRILVERSLEDALLASVLNDQWQRPRALIWAACLECEYRPHRRKQSTKRIPFEAVRDVCARRATRFQQRPWTIQGVWNGMLPTQWHRGRAAVDALIDTARLRRNRKERHGID